MNESWEYSIKPSFDNTDGPWFVDTIVADKVSLNKQQIAGCFERSVVLGIKTLVENQIKLIGSVASQINNKAPKTVSAQPSLPKHIRAPFKAKC